MIGAAINYIIKFIPTILSTLIAVLSLVPANHARLSEEINLQLEYMADLEQAYENGEIPSVNEANIFAGDLEAELEAGIKFNELSFIATHNSYQTAATEPLKKIYNNISFLTFGLVAEGKADFCSESLTNQLNCGIRSLEMDFEIFDRNGEISFTCMHSPHLDMTTSCYDFSLGLKEIAMWSDNNPDHLPITIIVEPKAIAIPLEDMRFFNIDYADELDGMFRETLGDKLFTPADMLRDYNSFGEMRAADDWCKVEDMLGKILILLHEGGTTQDYIDLDPSFKSQAMFPMLRQRDIERDCASFIICNDPHKTAESNEEIIIEKKLIVRTMVDSYGSVSQKDLEAAFSTDAQILSTDYPIRTDLTEGSYVVTFEGYKTVRKVGYK